MTISALKQYTIVEVCEYTVTADSPDEAMRQFEEHGPEISVDEWAVTYEGVARRSISADGRTIDTIELA